MRLFFLSYQPPEINGMNRDIKVNVRNPMHAQNGIAIKNDISWDISGRENVNIMPIIFSADCWPCNVEIISLYVWQIEILKLNVSK